MNLFWLKYASYAFLAGAMCLYFVLRLRSTAITRPTAIILYSSCIVLACTAWYVQESNANKHSPRQLIVGIVVSVIANHHKSGSIDDDFQLKLSNGLLSPKFSTDIVADDTAKQPIHQGDLLGVLYRTWDGVAVTIDEIEGQRQGWHYSRYDDGSAFIFGVSVTGFIALIGVLVGTRNQRTAKDSTESTSLNLNG